MSKLARKTHRLFAGEAPVQGNLAQFGSEAAGTPNFTGDPEQIQTLPAWGAGWGGAVVRNKVPPMQDMNALQYTFSYQLAYLLQMGVPEWKEDQEYYQNSFCQSGGLLYVSKLDGNVGRTVTDTNYWRLFTTTGSGPASARLPSAPEEYQYYDTDIGVWTSWQRGMWRTVAGSPGELKDVTAGSISLALKFNPGWIYHTESVGRVLANADSVSTEKRVYGTAIGAEESFLTKAQLPAESVSVPQVTLQMDPVGDHVHNNGTFDRILKYTATGTADGEDSLQRPGQQQPNITDSKAMSLAGGHTPTGIVPMHNTSNLGSGQSHNNMQPTLYVWRLIKG
jgi:microcystin-dependent protein